MEKNRGENRPPRDLNNPREPELEQQREGEVGEFEEEGETVGRQGDREKIGQGDIGESGRQGRGTPASEEPRRREGELVGEQDVNE